MRTLNGSANTENGMTIPQKLNIWLPYDPTILLLSYIQNNWKQRTERLFTHVRRCIIHNNQKVETTQILINWCNGQNKSCKQPKCPPTSKWTRWYIHTMKHLPLKRNEILKSTTTRRNLERITISEIGETQKDNYCMIPLTWGI